MNRRSLAILSLYTAFIVLWAVVFAPIVDVLFPSNIVRRIFGRYYSINNDRHVETLEFITLQAGIAIGSIDQFYEDHGYYPETIDSLIIENYPKYITDTFKSKYRTISFPRFIYARHVDEDAVADSGFYTIKAEFGKDYLLYDSKQDDWRLYRRGRSQTGFVIGRLVNGDL